MIKRTLLTLCCSASLAAVNAQSHIVTFKPGPEKGEDALMESDHSTDTFGSHHEIQYFDWTSGGAEFKIRSVIRFADMDTIPAGATIINAKLKMYGVPSSGMWGNSTFPGSPYPLTNEGWIQRITDPWNEHTITWDTQPATTNINEAEIPASTDRWNWNQEMDVTDLVKDIRSSGHNYGWMFLLQNEAIYRAVIFASSDHPNPNLWPELTVEYELPGTGIAELDMNKISLFPNPAQQEIHVSGVPAGTLYIIRDMSGRELLRTTASAIPLQQIAPGIYLLEVYTPQGTTGSRQFVKG